MRWELDLRGFNKIKLFVSGGIKEKDVPLLNPVTDAYGIGTSISNAQVIDYAMDIMEVEGKPVAKRSKWSGSKRVLRCKSCSLRKIIPNRDETPVCECGGAFEDVLIPVYDSGNIIIERDSASVIRQRVLDQLKGIDLP